MRETLLKLFSNTLFYYVMIVVPMVFDAFYVLPNHGGDAFTIFLMVYCFVYRAFTDSFRLVAIGKMSFSETWKLFVPFYRFMLIYTKDKA